MMGMLTVDTSDDSVANFVFGPGRLQAAGPLSVSRCRTGVVAWWHAVQGPIDGRFLALKSLVDDSAVFAEGGDGRRYRTQYVSQCRALLGILL